MYNVAIMGAGISGLSLAYYLQRRGVRVTVYEASDRAGGCMGSSQHQGFVIERGPVMFMDKQGALERLATSLGIGHELVKPGDAAKRRYLLKDGEVVALPQRPRDMLRSSVLSFKGKTRAAMEPFIEAQAHDDDESVAAFISRRFGQEVLERLVEPMITVTQLGRPEELSTRYVMSELSALERAHGSVLKSGVKTRMMARPQGATAPKSLVFGPQGTQALVDALVAQLGQAVELNTKLVKISADADGPLTLKVVTASQEHLLREHDALVLAAPAWAMAQLEWSLGALDGRVLASQAQTPYAPAALVSLGFKRDQIQHPLDGFGLLVPACEQRALLATIFTSTIFPTRAPAGHVLLTSTLGGRRRPQDVELDDQSLIELTRKELSATLGIEAPPTFAHVERHPRALPQCVRDHVERMSALDRVVAAHPGLFLASHLKGNASVPWLIQQAEMLAETISSAYLATPHQGARHVCRV